MNSANRNLVDGKYVKKAFPVMCRNGKYRDARTGIGFIKNANGTLSMYIENTPMGGFETAEKAYYSAVWDY